MQTVSSHGAHPGNKGLAPFWFALQQVGPCNATDPPIYCWSVGTAQSLSVGFTEQPSAVEVTDQAEPQGTHLRLDAIIDSDGTERGNLTIIADGAPTTSFLSYRALLDHHVTEGEQWAGFMAGVLTGGGGAYAGASGVVTFTARQVFNAELCKNQVLCYVKVVAVQGFL